MDDDVLDDLEEAGENFDPDYRDKLEAMGIDPDELLADYLEDAFG